MKFRNDQHIILIGFKHVGKSVIGRSLALRMGRMHLDLDHEIERLYETQFQNKLSCREIVAQEGEKFFRNLEHQALEEALKTKPCVISVGGGTPMLEENRGLIKTHCVIYITAPPKQVFERIMRKGRPSFFPADEDPLATFNRLWLEREKVYKQLATFTVNNRKSISCTMEQLIRYLM